MFSCKKKIYDIHLNVCVSQEETEISHREAEETFSRCQPLSHFLVTFPPTVPISISYKEAAKCCTKCFILPHLCLHPSISGVLIWTHCSCLCRSLALLQAKVKKNEIACCPLGTKVLGLVVHEVGWRKDNPIVLRTSCPIYPSSCRH